MKKALINNNIVIQVTDSDFPVAKPLEWVDCSEECHPGWKIYNNRLVEHTPDEIDAMGKDEAEIVTRFITVCRDQKLFGGILVDKVSIQTDDSSQQRLMAARIIAKEDPNYVVNWKSENGFVILTSPMIIALADKVRVHVQKCFDVEKIITERHETNPYAAVEDMRQDFGSYFDSLEK